MPMDENSLVVYTPASVLRHPASFLRGIARDLARSNWLGRRLAVRDLSAQYKQAALGVLWALIVPLATVATWLLLRGAGVVNVGDTGMPYWLYAVVGTLFWGIFVDALIAPLVQATAAKPMLARVSFPPEALVISGLYQVGVSAGIKLLLVLAAVLLAGAGTVPPTVVLVPIGVCSLVLAGTALGLLVTPLGLLYTDVAKSMPLLAQFMMYLAPVVYVVPASGMMGTIMEANPLTPLIQASRDWAVGIEASTVPGLLMVDGVALVLLAIVWVVYKAAMPVLVERMSA